MAAERPAGAPQDSRDPRDPPAARSGGETRAEVRHRHDLSNLLFAARLRIGTLRSAQSQARRLEHLDKLDACLGKAIEIVRGMDAGDPRD